MLKETGRSEPNIIAKKKEDLLNLMGGQVHNLVRSHDLEIARLSCKDRNINAASVAESMGNLRKTLEEYETTCIINVDEKHLFRGVLPQKTYIFDHDDCKSVLSPH